MPSLGRRTPETPKWLLCLAMLFVPGVYLVLLASAAITAGVGGGLLWLLIKARTINIPIILIGAGLSMGTALGLTAVIRGFIVAVRPPLSSVPGLLINRAQEPALMHFLIKLCNQLGTLSPNVIIICAEPTFFVTQGRISTLNGVAKGRILGIGLPFLGGLNVNELRAILAHEFAHFTGRDTMFSALVRPVYEGAEAALYSMAFEADREREESRSTLQWYAFLIPTLLAKLMLHIYLFAFNRLNLHISRKMEQRADAISASTCGSQSFRKALLKTTGIAMAYQHESSRDIIRKVCPPEHAANYFASFRTSLPHMTDLAKSLTALVYTAEAERRDAHPPLKSRLESAGNVKEQFRDTAPAANLFAQLETYENELHQRLIATQIFTRTAD